MEGGVYNKHLLRPRSQQPLGREREAVYVVRVLTFVGGGGGELLQNEAASVPSAPPSVPEPTVGGEVRETLGEEGGQLGIGRRKEGDLHHCALAIQSPQH